MTKIGVIGNLHSLFAGAWAIDQQYASSWLPVIHNILAGKTEARAVSDENTEPIVSFLALSSDEKFVKLTEDDPKTDVIAVLEIKSPIVKYTQGCGPVGTKDMMALMDEWLQYDNIKAVLLDIDSGGGQVSGTAEFAEYINNYPLPVGVYTDGMVASAAYYLAAGADFIYMNKHADKIGSIGAYLQFIDFTGYYEKMGAKIHSIYGTKSTEKNKPFREALKGKYELIIKEVVDPIVDKFHNDINSYRKGISEKVLKGATYSPEQALALGLIDKIAGKEEALFELIRRVEHLN